MGVTRPLAVIYATVVLDAAGIALIFPILPALLRRLSGTDEVTVLIGGVLALYALMQFVCSPLLGVLSDRFGRRPVLLVSLAGAVVDNLILAFTPWLWLLFVARAVAGVTAATSAVANAYIADITPEDRRAGRFGLFHACFGAGFVVGPVIGGVLGDISPSEPFLVAAGLNGVNLVLALFVLPETRVRRDRAAVDWRGLNPLAPLRWAFAFRALVPLLMVFVLISLVGQTYGTVWVLFVEDRFGWTPTEVGLSLGLFGCLVVAVQSVAIEPLIRLLGERGTLVLGLIAEAVALVVFAVASVGWMIFAAIPVLAFGGVALPALRAMQANAVDADAQGRLQGVTASLGSVAAIVGPLVFSFVYEMAEPDHMGVVWLIGAGLCLVGAGVKIAISIQEYRVNNDNSTH